MRVIIILFIQITFCSALLAQNDVDSVRNKLSKFLTIQMGSLIGCNDCSSGKEISSTAALTGGVGITPRFSVGLSVGLDSYTEWNLLPVMAAMSYDLLGKKNKLFVLVNGGKPVAGWRTFQMQNYGYKRTNYNYMFSYSLGYKIKTEKLDISFGIGRKTQSLTDFFEYPSYRWNGSDYELGEPSRTEMKSTFNRLMLWMAFGIN